MAIFYKNLWRAMVPLHPLAAPRAYACVLETVVGWSQM